MAPEEFVAERARLARELKAGGDAAAAAELAKLRKPSAPEWALGHVAREDPDAVEDWLDAAAALRDASVRSTEVGGGAVRAAMADHRAATARLTDVVAERAQPGGKPLSEPMLERVRAMLRSATADEGLAELLRAGRLTEEATAGDVSSLPAPRARRRAAKLPPAASERDREAGARARRRADLERRIAASGAGVERLRERAAERRASARSLDERVAEARRALAHAESEAMAARAAAKEAAGAAAAAEHELEELRAALHDGGE